MILRSIVLAVVMSLVPSRLRTLRLSLMAALPVNSLPLVGTMAM